MNRVYSLRYKQQLPAKPPVHHSRQDFQTTSWMLLFLRELHHNMGWKVILITPSSMESTHRYVVLQHFVLKTGLPLRALVAGLLAGCLEIPAWVAPCFPSVPVMHLLVRVGWQPCMQLNSIAQHHEPLVRSPRLCYNQSPPFSSDWTLKVLFAGSSSPSVVQNRCSTKFTWCHWQKALVHSLLWGHNYWKIASSEPAFSSVSWNNDSLVHSSLAFVSLQNHEVFLFPFPRQF